MRGVHIAKKTDRRKWIGSSPHARGPLSLWLSVHRNFRIIPACAGSTRIAHRDPRGLEDHPRMRGVHIHISRNGKAVMGSSPHARGPPRLESSEDIRARIIPACAGSTAFCKRSCMVIEDHPRMRGVHSPARWQPLKATGSSPHARGPQVMRVETHTHRGIIPACAGSTTFSGYREGKI